MTRSHDTFVISVIVQNKGYTTLVRFDFTTHGISFLNDGRVARLHIRGVYPEELFLVLQGLLDNVGHFCVLQFAVGVDRLHQIILEDFAENLNSKKRSFFHRVDFVLFFNGQNLANIA